MTIQDLIQVFNEAVGFAIDNAQELGTSTAGFAIAMVGIFILVQVEHYKRICRKARYGAPFGRMEGQLLIILGCGICLVGSFVGVSPWMVE